MRVRRRHIVPLLMRHHFHAPTVGGNTAVAGADTAERHPVTRAVAQGVQPSDATSPTKSEQMGQVTVEAGAVVTELVQQLSGTVAGIWAGNVPNVHFGKRHIDPIVRIDDGALVEEAGDVVRGVGHAALVDENVIVHLPVKAHAPRGPFPRSCRYGVARISRHLPDIALRTGTSAQVLLPVEDMKPIPVVVQATDHPLAVGIGQQAHHLVGENTDRRDGARFATHHALVMHRGCSPHWQVRARLHHAEIRGGDVHLLEVQHHGAVRAGD